MPWNSFSDFYFLFFWRTRTFILYTAALCSACLCSLLHFVIVDARPFATSHASSLRVSEEKTNEEERHTVYSCPFWPQFHCTTLLNERSWWRLSFPQVTSCLSFVSLGVLHVCSRSALLLDMNLACNRIKSCCILECHCCHSSQSWCS